MACINCLQNCGGTVSSDQCIEYTGDNIPLLDICTGDQLSKVEAQVINALLTALDGTGINLADVTLANCLYLQQQFIGKDPTLVNFLQLLIDSQCSLKTLIDQINTTIGGGSSVFNTACLTNLPNNPTRDQILQALLNDYCTTKSIVAGFPNTYVAQSDLEILVTQILQNAGVIGGGTIQYAQYIPIGVAFPYFGSIGNFDNRGVGLASAGFTGLHLCNGFDSTPDLRGRAVIGAVKNVPGGTLDSAVDPSLPTNPNTNFALADRWGEYYHSLTTSEIPSHIHTIVDPGHIHTTTVFLDLQKSGGSNPDVGTTDSHTGTGTLTSNNSKTNITISSTGGSSFHNNIQPSIAAYWIIRLS